jgi:hypothetical protein
MCAEYERLQQRVRDVLSKLTGLTTDQLTAFEKNDKDLFTRLDRELELTVGEKERCIGSLRQHVRDHKCQP